ncbi:MAG: hypothetical protein OK457_05690 [Thaumarchaeota archaeon]|nr:hypothetical protein [Nitrososphaerota archaeon]
MRAHVMAGVKAIEVQRDRLRKEWKTLTPEDLRRIAKIIEEYLPAEEMLKAYERQDGEKGTFWTVESVSDYVLDSSQRTMNDGKG